MGLLVRKPWCLPAELCEGVWKRGFGKRRQRQQKTLPAAGGQVQSQEGWPGERRRAQRVGGAAGLLPDLIICEVPGVFLTIASAGGLSV